MKQSGRGIDELKDFAVQTVRELGTVAMGYYGKGRSDVKFDEDLVTEAELALIDTFHRRLQHHFPEHEIYGDAPVRCEYVHGEKGCLWVYDALDGVANFQSGIPLWGTSLALMENFWPVLGVFYMPVTGDLFFAQPGGSALHGERTVRIRDTGEVNNESVLLTYSRFHSHYETKFPGKIRNLGCTAAHICYVAMGRAEAALLTNVSYQDLAAAQIILKAAGGELERVDGGTFHLNEYFESKRIEVPLLAAPRGAHGSLRKYLSRKA